MEATKAISYFRVLLNCGVLHEKFATRPLPSRYDLGGYLGDLKKDTPQRRRVRAAFAHQVVGDIPRPRCSPLRGIPIHTTNS